MRWRKLVERSALLVCEDAPSGCIESIEQGAAAQQIVPDRCEQLRNLGTRGPIYEAKMGVAMLAKLSGFPVIPMSYSADRYWRVPSWDKLVIPKPFARISIAIGEDIVAAREVDDDGLERCRQRIERTLNELNTRASSSFENKG